MRVQCKHLNTPMVFFVQQNLKLFLRRCKLVDSTRWNEISYIEDETHFSLCMTTESEFEREITNFPWKFTAEITIGAYLNSVVNFDVLSVSKPTSAENFLWLLLTVISSLLSLLILIIDSDHLTDCKWRQRADRTFDFHFVFLIRRTKIEFDRAEHF